MFMMIWNSSFFFNIFLVLMLSCYSPTAQLYNYPTGANLSTTWDISTRRYRWYPKVLNTENINGTLFSCGFYYDRRNSTSYVFGISINDDDNIVWSANPDHPVQENATLTFTAAGELVLKDVDGSIAWTTNTAGKSVVGMNLTDTGNLVLFDDRNSVVWQSFDYPTDCLLPGQKLSEGQKLISRASSADLMVQKGTYSLQFTDRGLFGYVESNPPQEYYILWRADTRKGRRHIEFLKGSLSLFAGSSEPSDPYVISISQASSAPQYMRLMPDGHLQVFEFKSQEVRWTMISDLTSGSTNDECSYPLVCGRNSICSRNQQCSCPAIEYFKPVNYHQPDQGCSQIDPLTCNSTKDQEFITLENTTYFSYIADMQGVDMETCKQTCLNNCSCKAVFFHYYQLNLSYGYCFLPSELFTMSIINDLRDINGSAFIKVQKVVTSNRLKSHQVATVVAGSTIGSSVLLLLVAIGFIMYRAHKRKSQRDAEMEEEYVDQVPGMPTRFSYDQLQTTTEKFSKKLGEGGFGTLFEGSLKDESKIAVKRLEGLTHIKKSFLAEVQSIGSIHHVNLVRLRGFCAWKSQRFLVYDFMSNGSLDKWIYHGNRERILEWECRKKIILDIAKGLSYLHEECRQKIIHLDIKPQNILLDDDFNAKISDFGLSKLMDRNQTEVMTTMRGTPGYLAPEWLSSVITEKVDVYSFGVILLEILCGRKNFDRSQSEESWHLLVVFQKCWEQGTLLDMVDTHSEDMQVHKTEVMEMMKVASWCLQRNFKRRPSMSSVVKVLEGGMNVESNLDYNFTDPKIQEPNVQEEKDFTLLSSSLLSAPR